MDYSPLLLVLLNPLAAFTLIGVVVEQRRDMVTRFEELFAHRPYDLAEARARPTSFELAPAWAANRIYRRC